MTHAPNNADEPDYIKCVHNERRGLLISSPPQCICEYCGNTWIYETPTPVCPVLKTVYDKTMSDAEADKQAATNAARNDETITWAEAAEAAVLAALQKVYDFPKGRYKTDAYDITEFVHEQMTQLKSALKQKEN